MPRRLWGPSLAVLVVVALLVGYTRLHPSGGGEKHTGTTKPSSPGTLPPSSSASPGSGGYAARIMQDHPLAFWPLDDGSRTVARDLTGHYAGTYLGGPARAAAIAQGLAAGRTFDGLNDHVTANAVTQVKSWPGYTMEAWVRLSQESQEEHIVAFNTSNGGNGPGILHDQPTRKFKFRDCEGQDCAQVFSKEIPKLGIPYHLVVTVDANGQGAFYVNGILQANFVSDHVPPTDGLFTIGGEYDAVPTPESFFTGEIADVAVYTHGLDAATIKAHYEAGL